jgi:hypothetical protein
MASPRTPIEEHPDIVEMRSRYDLASQRPTSQIVDGLGFLLGLYLAISPWIVGFAQLGNLTVNNFITGGAFALLSASFASAYGRTHGIAWVAPLIGVWTIISPWAVSGHMATVSTVINNVIVGGLAVLLGLAAIVTGMLPTRRGERQLRRPT